METDILLEHFRFLLDDFGFRIVASEVSPYFDNMWITLENDSLRVVIARDRGFVAADVSSPRNPTELLPLGLLRKLVLRQDPTDDVTIEEEADFLRLHFHEIVDLLSSTKLAVTVERIREIGRARLHRLFPGSVRDYPAKN